MVRLVKPDRIYREQIEDYRAEFINNGEPMNGSAFLEYTQSLDDWFCLIEKNSDPETVKERLVPTSTLLAISGDRMVGTVDIRHELNDYMLRRIGHIGYVVRKTERRKGYGRKMLALALDKCRILGLERILLVCNKKNRASAKIIMANGGNLENEIAEPDGIFQRYWIALDKSIPAQ